MLDFGRKDHHMAINEGCLQLGSVLFFTSSPRKTYTVTFGTGPGSAYEESPCRRFAWQKDAFFDGGTLLSLCIFFMYILLC